MPSAAGRLAVNTGTVAVIAALGALAALVMLAGRLYRPGSR
jgi:hypothetical protein